MRKLTGSWISFILFVACLGFAHSADAQLIGNWTGTISSMSAGAGFLGESPVTLVIEEEVTSSDGDVYFRGTLRVSPPLGTQNPIPIAGALDPDDNELDLSTGFSAGCGDLVEGPKGVMTIDGGLHILRAEGTLSGPGVARFNVTKQ